MPLEPGEPWGAMGPLPSATSVVGSDAELSSLLSPGSAEPELVVALEAGDVCRTLGGRGDVRRRLGAQATLATIDVGLVRLDDGEPRAFSGHVILRGRGWHGPVLAIMNTEWLGSWRMTPRAHPGDGLFDCVEGQLGIRERILARRRLPLGEHLPHPDLSASRATSVVRTYPKPRLAFVDGVRTGSCRRVEAILVPSGVTVAV